jgi:small subunit ribosomal protein S14
MAKKSSVQKMLKKEKLISRYALKRAELLKQMYKSDLSFEERMLIQKKLEALPNNSSKIRHKNRCWLTGRPKGYHRDLGVCRNALREMAHKGLVPGMTKASW